MIKLKLTRDVITTSWYCLLLNKFTTVNMISLRSLSRHFSKLSPPSTRFGFEEFSKLTDSWQTTFDPSTLKPLFVNCFVDNSKIYLQAPQSQILLEFAPYTSVLSIYKFVVQYHCLKYRLKKVSFLGATIPPRMRKLVRKLFARHKIEVHYKVHHVLPRIDMNNIDVVNLQKLHKKISHELAKEYLQWFLHFEKSRQIIVYRTKYKQITFYAPKSKEIIPYVKPYKEVDFYYTEEELARKYMRLYLLATSDFEFFLNSEENLLTTTIFFAPMPDSLLQHDIFHVATLVLFEKADPLSKTVLPFKLYFRIGIETEWGMLESRTLCPSLVIDPKDPAFLLRPLGNLFDSLEVYIDEFLKKYKECLIVQLDMEVWYPHPVHLASP